VETVLRKPSNLVLVENIQLKSATVELTTMITPPTHAERIANFLTVVME